MRIGQLAKQVGAGVASQVVPDKKPEQVPEQAPASETASAAAPSLPGSEPDGVADIATGTVVQTEPDISAGTTTVIEVEQPQGAEPDINVAAADPTTAVPASGFLMRGAKAAQARAVEQTRVEQAQSGFRFYLEVGGEARISFVDGALDLDGALDVPQWYEHRLFIGNRMTAVVCYETLTGANSMGPCPVCEAGHQTQYVGGMTIVNHTPYQIKSGQNAGKMLQNRRQQLVAPRSALETLQKLATTRNGLVAHVFDVYRKEKKDPRIGSVWDWVGQLTADQVKGLGEEWTPYNWDQEMKMIDAAQMAKLGAMATPYRPNSGGGGAATEGTASIQI